MIAEDGPLVDPEKFTFTYKMKDDTYELYDEQQILYPSHTVAFFCRATPSNSKCTWPYIREVFISEGIPSTCIYMYIECFHCIAVHFLHVCIRFNGVGTLSSFRRALCTGFIGVGT